MSTRTADNVKPELSAAEDPLARLWQRGRFPDLMPHRVEDILLVSTPYDSYILEEDGLLSELIFTEYMALGISHPPRVVRVTTGAEALRAIRESKFDLVISMLRLGDMDVFEFAQVIRREAPDLPLVLLTASEGELVRLGDRRAALDVDDIFVWKGDAKLFLAIIKLLEDKWNSEHDTEVGGVGIVILIEDSVRYRSSLLPIMYSEMVNQTRSVMLDGLNRMQKLIRLRARPKILVAETYEEGLAIYQKYRDYLFGIVSDVSFKHHGRADPQAGIEFICHVHAEKPDIPALLQSSDPRNSEMAELIGVSFLHKRSRTLLQDVRMFMAENFGFGAFVFRLPDKTEVGRASDLRSIPGLLMEIPIESIAYHARRNHFSNWLRARSEHLLARRLRPRKVSEFKDGDSLRRFLIDSFENALRENRRGTVEDFSRAHFNVASNFARIGAGSLGGKARGLAFMDALLAARRIDHDLEGARIYVPRSVVISTDIFDEFIDTNRLRTGRLYDASDAWIRRTFLRARLPGNVVEDLKAYLETERNPIAIRSSSLLEDSQYHPFAGVYDTHMIPNNHPDLEVRLPQLCDAVKLVFASTFRSGARKYLEATAHRIEEEKMAVMLQPLVGSHHACYFYPSFAGVARSYNFYPFGHMKPDEGVALVGLGLGQTIVEGGESLRFCPAHPHILPQLDNVRPFLKQSQKTFYAVDLSRPASRADRPDHAPVVVLGLDVAEKHGTLQPIGSVWSSEDDAVYDGIYRPGARIITFAHVLKADVFPLAEALQRVLHLAQQGMRGPVEVEFAVNLDADPKELAVLQMRPYGAGGNFEPVDIEGVSEADVLVGCDRALGNGVLTGICDILYVKPASFDAACTRQIAEQLSKMNDSIRQDGGSCVLIGPGRWGSTNTWLGIPVNWAQISTARIIVEAALENFVVDPSQGSHFFHNLTSMGIAYLTVNPQIESQVMDWAWLDAQHARTDTEYVRHVRLDRPLEARIDGRSSRAVILKPRGRAGAK